MKLSVAAAAIAFSGTAFILTPTAAAAAQQDSKPQATAKAGWSDTGAAKGGSWAGNKANATAGKAGAMGGPLEDVPTKGGMSERLAGADVDGRFDTADLDMGSKFASGDTGAGGKLASADSGMGGKLASADMGIGMGTGMGTKQASAETDMGMGGKLAGSDMAGSETGGKLAGADMAGSETGGKLAGSDMAGSETGGKLAGADFAGSETGGKTFGGMGGPEENSGSTKQASNRNSSEPVDARAATKDATAPGPERGEGKQAQTEAHSGMGGPEEATTEYPPCSPGPGDDRCIQLYERGVGGGSAKASTRK